MVLRSLLTMCLVAAAVACTGEDASVEMAGSASDGSNVLGAEVDAETLADIIQLDTEQNEANRIGDSEGMIDRMVADDTLWVGATGGLASKAQILAVVRHNFQQNPTRTKAGASPHDDYTVRRFGDTIIQLGRSNSSNADGSAGPRRRYMNVFMNRDGEWWYIAHGATTIIDPII